jgi:hypothetical protein
VLLKEFQTKVNIKVSHKAAAKLRARMVNERWFGRASHFCDKNAKKRANKFGTLLAQAGDSSAQLGGLEA